MRIVALAEDLATLGGAEKHGLMLLAPLAGRHDVTVFFCNEPNFRPESIRSRLGLALPGVEFRYCPSGRAVMRHASSADLFVNISYGSLLPNRAKKGLLLVYFPEPIADRVPPSPVEAMGHRIEKARHATYDYLIDWDPNLALPFRSYRNQHGLLSTARRLPLFFVRKLTQLPQKPRLFGSDSLPTYDLLLTNSRYTEGWVQRNYGRTAELLYPPIDTHRFVTGEKRREIIAVSRFDDGENSKKIHVLVEAFKAFHGSGLLRGWTLRICGGVLKPRHEAYLRRLRALAHGYPIEFHPNIPFSELVGHYSRASLFWHAMGYGEAPDTHPWRCEHFGMTAAEAMSAGCVPMVVRAGGLREIVADASCGYLWSSVEELRESVRHYLSLSEAESAELRASARRRAGAFGYLPFYRRAVEVYQSLGVATRSPHELVAARCESGAEAALAELA